MTQLRRPRHNRAQALIITALIITLMSMSTVYYVLETEKETINIQNTSDSYFSIAKISIRNTVIGALANTSNLGDPQALTKNLGKLASALHANCYDADLELTFTPLNTPPYQNGTYLSWTQTGTGVSSADIISVLNITGSTQNYHLIYETNITTALQINGTTSASESTESVNMTCTLNNEDGPALASRITVFYQNPVDGSWINVGQQNNLAIIDLGNGTYIISFTANSQAPLNVSAQVNDLRDILVIANTTLTQT
jgi:hypothetical protein